MSALEILIKLIKDSEGCKLKAYKCPAGIWTIGYGQTKGIKEGMIWTQQQADELFDTMIKEFETGVKKLVKVTINDNQLGALVSFAYNCGLGNLASSTLLKKLNASDFEGADKEFQKWTKGAGKVLPGLVKRRLQEATLFKK